MTINNGWSAGEVEKMLRCRQTAVASLLDELFLFYFFKQSTHLPKRKVARAGSWMENGKNIASEKDVLSQILGIWMSSCDICAKF